jgi:hypothetical protein
MDLRVTLIILVISILAIVIPIAIVLFRHRYVVIGLLTAEVNPRNTQAMLAWLGERLSNKPIVLEVTKDGKTIRIEARSRKDMEQQLQVIEKFLNVIKEDN